ncbi:MAG: phage portal protein, partial [Stackebrandtia sp.]
ERKQIVLEGAYESTGRLVRRFQSGDWDPRLLQMETIWRDASTPTTAQTADAAVKKYTAGIVPLRQTREDLGYTEAQIRRMEDEDEKQRQQDPALQLMRDAAGGPGVDEREPAAGGDAA